MKKGFTVFLVFFIVLLVLVGTLALAYYKNSFPVFTDLVNSVLFPEKQVAEVEVLPEVVEEPKDFLPTIENVDIKVFPSAQIKKNFISTNLEDYEIPNIDLKISEDFYGFSCSGDFNYEKSFEYPIISDFGIFGNALAFVTADSKFWLLDLTSGEIIQSVDLGFTPKALDSENQKANYCFYPIFEVISESGEKYSVVLCDAASYSLNPETVVQKSLKELFLPSKEATDFMVSRLESWGVSSDLAELPKLEFFIGDEKYLFPNDDIRLFLYSPEVAGKYTVGLMNQNGALVTDNAVVSVFKEDGVLVEVSLGYVATEPNVSVYLEEGNYYILAYRINSAESTLKEVYLGVK